MEFLERDEPLTFLRDGFAKAVSGEGHCFFIAGEAGIGKSSLLNAFLKEVEGKSKTYVALNDSLFTPRPLGPLYDFALQMDSDAAQKIVTTSSRAELFLLFARELTQHARPVVIVIEDIHWADEATLDFIKFFSRRITRTNCLLLLTYRDDEIYQQHPLRNVLGELSTNAFTRIQLKALSIEAVQTLATVKGFDGEEVYGISGGNPFYVNEIIAGYSGSVPENVKDAILSVYNRQTEATKNAWQILSVIPEGLEWAWLNKIDVSLQEAIDESLSKGILIQRNNRIVFKHELFRRAIESSLSPFKRLQLNKTILQLFFPLFEQQGAIERIVHYAKNGGENNLVVQFAPLAAKQAATVGAHTEAAKLYLAAIEYTEEKVPYLMVELYEAYTYECYLTNRIKEAIIYEGKALKIWQQKEDAERIGNSLRFLSRLWWYDGHRQEAEGYGTQAIETFAPLPPSKGKAMAFSNLSQLKMLSEEVEECIRWGTLAMEMSKELNDEETLCHALNNVGSVKWLSGLPSEGMALLKESLRLALKNTFHEHAARAYTNIISSSLNAKEYDVTATYLADGLAYCEELDLDSWLRYILSKKAKLLMETGNWKEAFGIAENLLSNPTQPGIVKIGALVVKATIMIRRGDAGALSLLQEAKASAFVAKEHQRIIPVVIACLEYEWLTGETTLTEEEFKTTLALIDTIDNRCLNSEAVFWIKKARPADAQKDNPGKRHQKLEGIKSPTGLLQKSGEGPYQTALFLFDGDEDDKRAALTLLQNLGAVAVYQKLKQEMRLSGIKKIPRGVRPSTQSNPAQLTSRELDILQLLRTGAQNKEIASVLFISPKTVDHHISSILFKLDVSSRTKAVSAAERLGILK